jgi:hypothetical protein
MHNYFLKFSGDTNKRAIISVDEWKKSLSRDLCLNFSPQRQSKPDSEWVLGTCL